MSWTLLEKDEFSTARRSEIAKEQERVQAIANQLWHDNSLPEMPGLRSYHLAQSSVHMRFLPINIYPSLTFKGPHNSNFRFYILPNSEGLLKLHFLNSYRISSETS